MPDDDDVIVLLLVGGVVVLGWVLCRYLLYVIDRLDDYLKF